MDIQAKLNMIGESIKILQQKEFEAYQAKVNLFKEQNILLAQFILENEILKDTVWILSDGSNKLDLDCSEEEAINLINKLPLAYGFSTDHNSLEKNIDELWDQLDPTKINKSFNEESVMYYAFDLDDEISISFDGPMKGTYIQLRFNSDHLAGLNRFIHKHKIKIESSGISKSLDRARRKMISLEKLDHMFGSR